MTHQAAVPAGWYPDPQTPGQVRYYDGAAWTEHVSAQPLTAYGGNVAAPLGAHPDQAIHWLMPTGRSGWAIAAGYVALVAMFFWPLGPVALGLGIHAVRVAGRTRSHGRGRAVFAIIVGSLATLATLIWVLSSL